MPVAVVSAPRLAGMMGLLLLSLLRPLRGRLLLLHGWLLLLHGRLQLELHTWQRLLVCLSFLRPAWRG